MPILSLGDTPSKADPSLSWPTYSVVGNIGRSQTGRSSEFYDNREYQWKREDEEILIILSAILKEL